jgi:hypothetical protein
MFTTDNLNSFTVVALKKYCNDNELKSSGHKGELIQRVKNHLENKEQVQTQVNANERFVAKSSSPFNPRPFQNKPNLTKEEFDKRYNAMFNRPPF